MTQNTSIADAETVGQLFLDRVAATPNNEAFRKPTDPGWKSYTWAETGELVKEWAAGLLALDVETEERVGIASNTNVEWIFADLANMCSGAATTTVYASTPAEDVEFILGDSDTHIVFVEDQAQLDKVVQARANLPKLRKAIIFDGEGDGDFSITTDQLAELGRQHLAENPNAVQEAVDRTSHDGMATLIYTSGTTGKPKGVVLTHGNWVYEGKAMDAIGFLEPHHLQFLWLPLAHSFGKVLISGALLIGLPSAVDGRVSKIQGNLKEIRPYWSAAVPRIFEKIYGAVNAGVEEAGGVKQKLFTWAFDIGKQAAALRRSGQEPKGMLKAQHNLATKLVLSKVSDAMGGRMEYFVSGSAPLSRDVAEWFDAAGLPILEGYGLTETSAFTFVNRPESYKFGTVGLPAPGTEMKIAEDGEILVKGPGVMVGYHNLPETTAEVFTDDGWFMTGDIGEIDEDGLLKITDRKKDLIKTSGGKYVAPQGIETLFKAHCPYASNIVVHGDGRNFVSALVTLDPDSIQEWAEQNGLGGKSYGEIATSQQAKDMVQGYIEQVNAELPRWETVKKFHILEEDLSIEKGELTPSLKVKRKVVEKKHMDVLNEFYV
jgi:long-chain acyl-CoA synthetase